MTWEQYLSIKNDNHRLFGEENPIKQSNYGYWIKKFEKFKPLIFNMDEMSSKMKMINPTDDPNYKKIPNEYRQIAQQLLDKEIGLY